MSVDTNLREAGLFNGGDAVEDNGKVIRFVATYRCQSPGEKRASIVMRTMEGEYGTLQVTVVSAVSPGVKAAKILKYPLKPLSLHARVSEEEDSDARKTRNKIKISGPVTVAVRETEGGGEIEERDLCVYWLMP